MQLHNHTQQMQLNLQMQSKTILKIQDNKFKKNNYTKKTYNNARYKLLQFKIGDTVLLSTKNLAIQGPRELAGHFVGPFHVIHQIGT